MEPQRTGLRGCHPLRPVFTAGLDTIHQASENSTNGRPSGRPASATTHNQLQDVFHCEYPGCTRSFPTTIGRGQHHRKAHKAWYDARVVREDGRRTGWTHEEISLLARREAELATEGVRFINQALQETFPHRTIEAIKGQRRPQAYKEKVQQYIEEHHALLAVAHSQSPPPASPPPPLAEGGGESVPSPASAGNSGGLLDYLASLPSLPGTGYQSERLQGLLQQAQSASKNTIFERLSLYLRDVFPDQPRNRGSQRREPPPQESRRQTRRRDYANTQRHWRQNRVRCINSILGNIEDAQQPSREVMEPYWTTVFTRPATNTVPKCESRPVQNSIWSPITPDDIRKARPSLAVSPGPDGLTARQLRAVPLGVLTRIFNLVLWCERLPDHLTASLTIFIPKKAEARYPEHFRPISISSALARLLHKIIAQRVDTFIELDNQQRAFRAGFDGCRDNTVLLDAVLRSRYNAYKSLYMATLDLAQAFDSVEQTAIIRAAEAAGLPPEMLQYLRRLYAESTTTLSGDGWNSNSIRVTRGVKQGDPLSPVIFNIVMDHLLRSLPPECGVSFNGSTIRAMAFADDLVLLADSPTGLQHLLDHTSAYLADCGLRINNAKSHTVSLYGSGNLKKTVVDASRIFNINGQPVRALCREEPWTYLGVSFSPEGRTPIKLTSILSPHLQRLTKAPLKPQQRIFALKTIALPKIFYHMALGKITINALVAVDKMVRAQVRQWLALPNDTPTGYFHAPVGEGGLGIPSVRWLAPLHRRNRLLGLVPGRTEHGIDDPYLAKEIALSTRRLTEGGVIYTDDVEIKKRWANLLHKTIEGGALRNSSQVTGQHQWVTDGTALLTGRDYIQCHKVRTGSLPTRSRTTRGRRGDRLCRAGCMVPETNNHVLQICHRTHNIRIRRHDSALAYIGRNLRRQGFTVQEEPSIITSEGRRKPDIVATMGRLGLVIDAHIVGDQSDLERARSAKIRKYADNPDIERAIRRDTGATIIRHLPVIVSWRGIWCKTSASDLLSLGTVDRRDLAVISTRVLIGGAYAHRVFTRTTGTQL